MSINLTGTGLTVDKVVQVARGHAPVALDPEARKRIEKCRALLEDKIQKKEIMYGVNTGIGELANVVLTQDQVEEYKRYLIYSNAAGYGIRGRSGPVCAPRPASCSPTTPAPVKPSWPASWSRNSSSGRPSSAFSSSARPP